MVTLGVSQAGRECFGNDKIKDEGVTECSTA